LSWTAKVQRTDLNFVTVKLLLFILFDISYPTLFICNTGKGSKLSPYVCFSFF